MSKPVEPDLPGPDLPEGVHKTHPFNIQHGAHKEHPGVHAHHQLHEPFSDGHDESSVQIYPSQIDGARGRHIHPIELEAYVVGAEDATEERPEGAIVLRCYYGELHYSICSIGTEGHEVEDTDGDDVHIFPIGSQAQIPGIKIVVPADFTFQEVDDDNNFVGQAVMLKYAEWVGTEVREVDAQGENIDNNEDEPDQPFGSVYLKWTATETDVSGAELILVYEDEDPEQDNHISNLKKVGAELKREQTTGDYFLLIGEHRDVSLEENEGAAPVEQKIFDNVYWAVTIVKGSTSGGSTTTYEDSPGFINVPNIQTTSRPQGGVNLGGGPGGGPGGGGILDGPGGGGGVNLGGLHAGSESSGSASQTPVKGGVVDQPAGKVASPIKEKLEELGLNPNKQGFQDKFKMQKSGLNLKANPEYGGFTEES